MTDKQTAAESTSGNTEKDPSDWVTGDEPMTGAQRSYLKTLSEEAKVDFDDTLSKADASRRIDELQHLTGRGLGQGGSSSSGGERPAPRRAAASSQAGEEDPGASLGESGEPAVPPIDPSDR